jgi:hypothetical protein
MTRTQIALLLASLVSAACPILLAPGLAQADERSIIKLPGDHPRYVFEAEPHLVLGWGDPFFRTGVPGAGFRGTFHIANGFIKTINDSVGVGVGIDVTSDGHVLVPVVLQWNFWLSTHWSVFGEPGFAIGAGGPRTPVWPALFVGGRLHFTPRIALTMRLGYPALSVGVSFLL